MKKNFIFITLLLITSCENKLEWIKTPVSTTPKVYSISPNTGSAGTEVKISGINFSATLSNNVITINGTSATIVDASPSTLIFIAPKETSGRVIVTVNNQPAENKPVFTYK